MTNEKIGTLFRECHYSLHRFVTNQEVFDETIKRIKRSVSKVKRYITRKAVNKNKNKNKKIYNHVIAEIKKNQHINLLGFFYCIECHFPSRFQNTIQNKKKFKDICP